MPLPGKSIAILASVTGAILLSSCGIRLPVDSAAIPSNVVRTEVSSQTTSKETDVAVYLMADTYHTSMAFPYEWLASSGFIAPAGFGNPKFVVMSWGNIDAYSQEGIQGPGKLLRVLFTPTHSVMEVIPVNWHIKDVCPDQRIWQKNTPHHYGKALSNYLNQCVTTEESGLPVVVRPSSWGDGVQLESKYRYFIPRVCNIWSAQAIESIGGEINPWFALTANGLIRQAEKPPNNFTLIWSGTSTNE